MYTRVDARFATPARRVPVDFRRIRYAHATRSNVIVCRVDELRVRSVRGITTVRSESAPQNLSSTVTTACYSMM